MLPGSLTAQLASEKGRCPCLYSPFERSTRALIAALPPRLQAMARPANPASAAPVQALDSRLAPFVPAINKQNLQDLIVICDKFQNLVAWGTPSLPFCHTVLVRIMTRLYADQALVQCLLRLNPADSSQTSFLNHCKFAPAATTVGFQLPPGANSPEGVTIKEVTFTPVGRAGAASKMGPGFVGHLHRSLLYVQWYPEFAN